MNMIEFAKTVADKVSRIRAGERVVVTVLQLTAVEQIILDIRTVLNPDRTGTLDVWVAYI